MHFWSNPAITRTHKAYDIKSFRAKRPKGLTDAKWAEFCAEELLAKQVALNTVPKMSQKGQSSSQRQKED